MNEQWSDKYKRSIDCDNPKGFSQRAHCQGKKKTFKEIREYMFGTSIGPIDVQKPMSSMGSSGQFFPNRKYATTLPTLSATYTGPGLGTYNPMTSTNTKKEDLYSDDNPKDTIKGTGYGSAEKAKTTIKKMKNVDDARAMQTINTMYNRAKHNKNQNQGMRDAMKIFKKWIDKNKKED